MKYDDLRDLGSQTAKGGFRNEDDVVNKFNNWQFEDKPHISEQDKKCIRAINFMFETEFIYDFVIVGNKEFVVYNKFMDQVDTGTNTHVDNIMIGISKCI